MGRKRKFLRRLLWVFCGLALLLVVLLVAFPLWFPWLLKPVMGNLGVKLQSYERMGYTRLALKEVRFERKGLAIELDHGELYLPTYWIWQHYLGGAAPEKGPAYVSLSDWSVKIRPSMESETRAEEEESEVDSLHAVFELVESLLPTLRSWVPSLESYAGRLILLDEEDEEQLRLEIPELTWSGGQIVGKVQFPRWEQTVDLSADFQNTEPHELVLNVKPADASVRLRLGRNDERSWELISNVQWRTNRVDLQAVASREDWLPTSASLTATNFHLPGEMARLPQYDFLDMNLQASWEQGTYQATIHANASPASNIKALPSVEVDAQVKGTMDRASIHRFHLRMPGLQVEMSDPLQVALQPPSLESESTLSLQAQLKDLPASPVSGELQGTLTVVPGQKVLLPNAVLSFKGQNIRGFDQEIHNLNLEAKLEWPLAVLQNLSVTMTNATELASSARVNLEARRIESAEWKVSGGALKQFLPEGYGYDSLAMEGTAQGAFTNPVYSASVHVTQGTTPFTHPADLQINAQGEGWELESLDLELTAPPSRLAFHAAAGIDPPTQEAYFNLKELNLKREEETLYALEGPALLKLQKQLKGPAEDAEGWKVSQEKIRWLGQKREMTLAAAVEWPSEGNIAVHWEGLQSRDFRDFLSANLPDISLAELSLLSNWSGGPMEWRFVLDGSLPAPDGEPLAAHLQMAGDRNGVAIEPLILSGTEGPVLESTGRLPLVIEPSNQKNPVQLFMTESFHLHAKSQRNPAFWKRLEEMTGITVSDPALSIRVDGTFSKPDGHIRFDASQIEPPAGTTQFTVPPLSNLRVNVAVSKEALTVDQLAFDIAGQPVNLNAHLPLGEEAWLGLLQQRQFPEWKKASLNVQMNQAELAPFAELAPQLLVPQGTLDMDLNVHPGLEMTGYLQLEGVATRPLMPLGPVREIQAKLRFQGREVFIENTSAMAGGQTVSIEGIANLETPSSPEIHVNITGEKVPLVRQPGTILRSDLNLTLNQSDSRPLLVSGSITLRDSLFLQDIRDLIPGGLAQPAQRPPYFSIEEEPLASWNLDLEIAGDRFMQVRSPVFQGVLSTSTRLRGTLQEPMILGEVRINSGQIQFPFGNLAVNQGFINFTSENPYQPQLFITASSPVYGYSVKLEVSGTANNPMVTFSSNPPLNSEEILLMLTAGELPKSEYTFSRRDKASRLAMFIGRDLLRRLGAGEGAADRLTIRSGENISEQGKLTYTVEFKLTEDWSAVGEYDRFNAVNAGLKWEIYSK